MKKMLTKFRVNLLFFSIAAGICCAQNAVAADPRISLQDKIDRDAPLNIATFVGTHNSYNSGAYHYFPYLTRYNFPNHKLSVTDQLNAGARFIEYDVHYTSHSAHGAVSQELLLCHGRDNDIGCSMTDRPLTQGLSELKNWLSKHPDEVVMMYLEDHVDGKYDRYAEQIKSVLGDFIFKPSEISGTHTGCQSTPISLTKNKIITYGHKKQQTSQVLIFNKHCVDNENFNQLVFSGFGGNSDRPIESQIGTFEGNLKAGDDSVDVYPDCGRKTTFHNDKKHQSVWRVYESRAGFDQFFKPRKTTNAFDAQVLSKCGVNIINFDMLKKDDARLLATIWSWAKGYPKSSNTTLAKYVAEKSGFVDTKASEAEVHAALCKEKGNDKWRLSQTVPEPESAAACQLLGDSWFYAMPINGLQMQQIKDQVGNDKTFWVNYHKVSGQWQGKYVL